MKKRVGILTFHASHNYGSMLQAYALQQVIMNMGFDCEVINFRTERQKEFYLPPFMRGRFLGKIKRILIYFPFIYSLIKKHRLFEEFLKNKLILTPKEYTSLEELISENIDFDYYISGSDQIWNVYCFDFDWAYFLPFVKNGKKIAYAPSMGSNSWRKIDSDKISYMKELLSGYTAVSVREKDSSDRLKKELNIDLPIMVDPTLLLPPHVWEEMAGDKPIISEKYIFLYTPWFDATVFEEAKKLSTKLKIKIVVSQIYNNNKEDSWLFDSRFISCISVGPVEFLNLCKFSICVIGASFHLVVFALIFCKPFLTLNGLKDSRISNILKMTNLENRSVDSIENNYQSLFDIDFSKVTNIIEHERMVSLEWLAKSLSI